MIKHVWSVLCENRIIDKDTNNISLINIIEQLNFNIPGDQSAENQPFEIHGVLNVVSMWTRTYHDKPSTGKSRIRIKNPDNKYVALEEIPIDLIQFVRLRSLGSLKVIFQKTGIYSIIVEVESKKGWVEVASIPLEVHINLVSPPE